MVIEVPDVDTEEVGIPYWRTWGDAHSSFRDVPEEKVGGSKVPACSGPHGPGVHGVKHMHSA